MTRMQRGARPLSGARYPVVVAADPARKLATAEDLLALGDRPFEVVGGELVEKAAPAFPHGDAQGALYARLRRRFHGGGGDDGDGPGGWWIGLEVEVELGAHEVYRPDLCGWRHATLPRPPRERPVRVVPDWVCEVLSPSHGAQDLVHKLRVYQRAGVRHYSTLDYERGVLEVRRNTSDGYLTVLTATRGETVHAEPFEALELRVDDLLHLEA